MDHIHEMGGPEKFKGIDAYYSAHPGLDWGKIVNSTYKISLPDVDPYSGSLDSSHYPCLYVVDELEFNKQKYQGVRVLDCHGHVEKAVWMGQNIMQKAGKSDVIDLTKVAFSTGQPVDLLLICSEFALGYEIEEPPPNYYEFLDKQGVVYLKPFEEIIPTLSVTPDGKLTGRVTALRQKDENAFANLQNLSAKLK